MAVAAKKPRARARPVVPFTLPHFKRWARELILDNDEPWRLDAYQERFVEDVFAGFPLCWLVVPEENGKTTFVSGLSLYVCEHKQSAYVPVAASSRDQAEWIYRQAEGFVYRSGLRGVFKCLEGYRRIRCDDMGSRIQVFAADDRSGDGIIPGGIAVLDELHRHRDLALYRTWAGKLRKRGAQLVVISTAGEVGGEFELERARLRQEGSRVERPGRCFTRSEHWLGRKPLAVLHDYAVPDDGDIEDIDLVLEANPFSGVSASSLREKRGMMSNLGHWARFTCNRPTRVSNAAVQEREWAGAQVGEWAPEGEPLWLGLDVAWKWDTTALVPLWCPDPEVRVLGPATVLHPPRDGSSLDPDAIKRAVYALHGRNPLHTVVMDVHRADELASWLRLELGADVIEHSQANKQGAQDYERFMEALRLGWLRHTGDMALTRHVLNGVAKQLPMGDYRFDRPYQGRNVGYAQQEMRLVDALIAAAMVHSAYVAEVLGGAVESGAVF